MPVIDGRIGPQTRNAILSFQRRNRHQLLSLDGVVHPANYGGRMINMRGPLMTITLLDYLAYQEGLLGKDPDHIAGLIRIAPQLASWLR
jgi:hypothetical protein